MLPQSNRYLTQLSDELDIPEHFLLGDRGRTLVNLSSTSRLFVTLVVISAVGTSSPRQQVASALAVLESRSSIIMQMISSRRLQRRRLLQLLVVVGTIVELMLADGQQELSKRVYPRLLLMCERLGRLGRNVGSAASQERRMLSECALLVSFAAVSV